MSFSGKSFFELLRPWIQPWTNLTQIFISLELDWGGFSVKIRWSPDFLSKELSKLDEKGLHRLWVSSRTKKFHYSGPNNGKFFTTSAPKSRWGGLFSFLQRKSASKAQKICYFAYFLGQWGEIEPIPAPPDYATDCLGLMFLTSLNAHFL